SLPKESTQTDTGFLLSPDRFRVISNVQNIAGNPREPPAESARETDETTAPVAVPPSIRPASDIVPHGDENHILQSKKIENRRWPHHLVGDDTVEFILQQPFQESFINPPGLPRLVTENLHLADFLQ